jgi:hypothetical protein
MRRITLSCVRFVLALMSLGWAASAQALPIDYTITFTQTHFDQLLPIEGSFTYDAEVPQFTNFHVAWYDVAFDVTADANNPASQTLDGHCGNALSGPALTFAILSGTTACQTNQVWALVRNYDFALLHFFASEEPFSNPSGMINNQRIVGVEESLPNVSSMLTGGTFTIDPVDSVPSAVPEPTSIALLASGLVGVVLRHRRRG